MTLREIRARYPHLFHPNQTWFNGEAFMDREGAPYAPMPSGVEVAAPDGVWREGRSVPFAVSLATAFVRDPTHPIWKRYLWTADTDHLGQRVYMGVNEQGMELHRHLHITERWGVPTWA